MEARPASDTTRPPANEAWAGNAVDRFRSATFGDVPASLVRDVRLRDLPWQQERWAQQGGTYRGL